MSHLTANELKRSGVTAIENALQQSPDSAVTIDVRGKSKYVILPIATYDRFREFELDNAIAEAEACYLANKTEEITDFDALEKQLKAL